MIFMKKVLIIVAQKNYQPKEYKDARDELEKSGFAVDTASLEKGTAFATDSSKTEVSSINDVNLDDYKAVSVI